MEGWGQIRISKRLVPGARHCKRSMPHFIHPGARASPDHIAPDGKCGAARRIDLDARHTRDPAGGERRYDTGQHYSDGRLYDRLC
jgi:hypothetical protein